MTARGGRDGDVMDVFNFWMRIHTNKQGGPCRYESHYNMLHVKNYITGLLLQRIAVLVALSDTDLKCLLLGRTLAWNCIDGMITTRRNRFGSNAAAEFEVSQNACVKHHNLC